MGVGVSYERDTPMRSPNGHAMGRKERIAQLDGQTRYRDTSLISKHIPLGPYGRSIYAYGPTVLLGGGRLIMSEVPLYCHVSGLSRVKTVESRTSLDAAGQHRGAEVHRS